MKIKNIYVQDKLLYLEDFKGQWYGLIGWKDASGAITQIDIARLKKKPHLQK